jgi:hypothetical protein
VLAQATCGILHLEIGAVNLNALGVVVTTSPIALDLSGDTAAPLGALVCAVLNLVGSLAGLVNLLTSLVLRQNLIQLNGRRPVLSDRRKNG